MENARHIPQRGCGLGARAAVMVRRPLGSHPEGIAVYNFQVDDLHDYFVVSPDVQLPQCDASSPYSLDLDLPMLTDPLTHAPIRAPPLLVHNANDDYDKLTNKLTNKAKKAKPARGANLNPNDAVSRFGVYEIKVNGVVHKFDKADLNRVTKSSGLPTRLHQHTSGRRSLAAA